MGARALAERPRLPSSMPGVDLPVEGHHGLLDALPDEGRVGVGVAHARRGR